MNSLKNVCMRLLLIITNIFVKFDLRRVKETIQSYRGDKSEGECQNCEGENCEARETVKTVKNRFIYFGSQIYISFLFQC